MMSLGLKGVKKGEDMQWQFKDAVKSKENPSKDIFAGLLSPLARW